MSPLSRGTLIGVTTIGFRHACFFPLLAVRLSTPLNQLF